METKNYIVTGASSGIGQATCIALAEKGYNVILIGRNAERLQITLDNMRDGVHTILPFDVSDIANIERLITGIFEKYQHIEGFVHSAGIGGYSKLQNTSYDCLHSCMLVHFYAFVEFVRCLSKLKKKADPLSIVGVSSLASTTTEKYFTCYAAAKSAMEAAVRSLATELISRNVRICAIRPAFVATPMNTFMEEMHGDFGEHLKKTGYQPLGIVPSTFVANTLVYMLDGGMEYINGVSIPINAGAAI